MNKRYMVRYRGWLSGSTTVFADDEMEAEEKVLESLYDFGDFERINIKPTTIYPVPESTEEGEGRKNE